MAGRHPGNTGTGSDVYCRTYDAAAVIQTRSCSPFLAGIGYALFATVHSYTALLVVAVIASLGLHMWMPLNSSLAMNLSGKEQTGQVMGTLNAIGAFASIVGMGALTLISKAAPSIPLELYYLVGGGLIIVSALLIFRLPNDIGATETKPPRMLLKGKYWLFIF